MRIERITDLERDELRDFRSLTDVALRRVSEPAGGLYIAESTKVIGRALAAGHRPRSFLLIEQWLPDVERLLADDELYADVPVFVGPPELLKQLTGFDMHRGALASMHRPALMPVEELLAGARRVVVLEDIADHTNVGAIFRSVAGLGADAVLITPRCADPLYRRSVRVSMGQVLAVPYARLDPWPEGLQAVRAAGFRLLALTPAPDAVPIQTLDAEQRERPALLLGAEGSGLSAAALGVADARVVIPMHRGVDSLNVASAAAVAFWELCRTA
jgi:tRNA G18 (ribose-2'-O)-methylase SpoU